VNASVGLFVRRQGAAAERCTTFVDEVPRIPLRIVGLMRNGESNTYIWTPD
jgi:hypothetical protein